MARSKRAQASGRNSFLDEFSAMSRQPFYPFLKRHPGGQLQIGNHILGKRPELEVIIGNCLMAWPIVEAELGLALGQLLGINNEAALAVFQTLRRSTAQREAVWAAAEATLGIKDKELFAAMLDVHKSIEANRTMLSHGHFGIYEFLPDGIVCATTRAYVRLKAKLHLANMNFSDAINREFLDDVSFFKKKDLEAIREEIFYCGNMWVEAIRWLRSKPPRRDELYLQLCDQPRIQQALAKPRRENTRGAPL